MAKKNQWKNKFEEIHKLLQSSNINRKLSSYNWQKSFEIEYRNLKKKVLFVIYSFVIIFSLLFISPVPFYLGKYLEINDAPSKNSLVVALSGYGNSRYINNTYQQRSLDVFYYYKNGYANKILLSGRKQLIEELKASKTSLL